jgi:diguanylate cyclase (GGDEF)-like protein
MAWRAATHPALDAATKRAWRLMGAAFLAWWCGDVIWFWYEVVRSRQPFPSWADAGYLAFYPLLMWGLLTLPGPRRSLLDRLKLWLDTGIVFVAGGMALWYLVIEPTVRDHESHWLNKVLSVAYPVGDLVVLFAIAIVLLRRPAPGSGAALRLLVVGAVFFVVADVAYAHLSLADAYEGGDWPDAFWLLALFFFVFGAQRQRQLADRPAFESGAQLAPARISKLPYLALVFGYGILVWVGGNEAVSPLAGLLIASVVLTVFVAARQLAAQQENLRLTAALAELATTDSLTGVRNRRSFFEMADREWARAARTGEPLSAVMLDVDHFKQVNDRLGHAAGDEVLAAVARRCEEELRNVDVFGRYGGDEFVALLPGTSPREAYRVAQRLREAVAAEPAFTEAGPVSVRVSVGVACTLPDCPTVLRLMGRADAALYAAKHEGRDRAEAWCPGMALTPA